MIYLNVPFEYKDFVKNIYGGKWDRTLKLWKVDESATNCIRKFPLKLNNISMINNEKRDLKNSKLYIDCIPRSCFYISSKYHLNAASYLSLEQYAFARSNHKCEYCKDKCAHVCEHWIYDDIEHIQTLVCFSSVCDKCYHVIKNDKEKMDIEHLKSMRKWNDEQLKDYVSRVDNMKNVRDEIVWDCNIQIVVDNFEFN